MVPPSLLRSGTDSANEEFHATARNRAREKIEEKSSGVAPFAFRSAIS